MSKFKDCHARRPENDCVDYKHNNCDGCNIYQAYLLGLSEGRKQNYTQSATWIETQYPLPLSDGSRVKYKCSSCCSEFDNKMDNCPTCGSYMLFEEN